METQNNQSQNPQQQPEFYDRRTARRQRFAQRRAGSPRSSTLILGLLLVLLGAVFYLQNTNVYFFHLKNWGALFILIPAVAAFERSYRYYRDADNQLTAQSGGALLAGAALTVVTVVILLDLNWNYFGPILLVLSGVGVLATMALRSDGTPKE